MRNLLANTADIHRTLTGNWESIAVSLAKDLDFGTDYSLSFECESTADSSVQARFNYISTVGEYKNLSKTQRSAVLAGENQVTLLIPAFSRPDDLAGAYLMIQAMAIADNGAQLTISRPMLVEGDTPATWAPAEGEGLAGGGALMSANLLDGVKPVITRYGSMADGVITSSTPKDKWSDVAQWPITTNTLAENQTVHIGISAKWHSAAATKGTAWASVKYEDAAGNTNAVNVKIDGITTEWQRFSLSAVIPSGMHIVDFHISGQNLDAAYDATNPTLSLGSPVTLASSAHTPYATQDHVMVTYATKASLKVTDDFVKAEVSARAQTDRNVADLSSRLTQTANSLSSEISDRRSAITTVTGLANAAQSTADSASEQTVELSSRLDQSTTDITATIESKVQTVQRGVDDNASDVKNLNDRLSDEIRTRKSFMRFSEESSDPTLTLGQTDSPAQVKLTNKQLQFLYLNTVVAYMSGDALLINNAKILQQLQLGGFAFVPRQNGNLSLKWVGGDA